MKRSSFVRIPVAVAVGVGVLIITLLPAAAVAGTHRHRDAAGDLYAYSVSPDGVAAPRRRDGDIAWSRVVYRPRALVMTMRMYRLDRDVASWGASYQIRTSKGEDRNVELTARPGRRTSVKMFELSGGDLVAVRCAISKRVSYRYDRIRVRVPVRCLDRPRWVRVGLGLTGTTRSGGIYLDDANISGSGTGTGLVAGPRVRRG